jgi:hypothetical protein
MAVEVKTAPTFEAGIPKPLFDPQILGGGNFSFFRYDYDVAPDGKRFLVISVPTTLESSTAQPITVVVNWQAMRK